MESPETSATAIAIMAAAGLASLLTLFRLFERHISGRPIIPYESRRPVPWNFIAPLVMLGPAAVNIAAGFLLDRPSERAPESAAAILCVQSAAAAAPAAATHASAWTTAASLEWMSLRREADASVTNIWIAAAASVLITAACYLLLIALYRATPRDLGLPKSWREARRDVALGAAAWAASLAPIYAVMLVLHQVFEPSEGHPLLEQFSVNPSASLMAAIAAAAVIVAPIVEETSFRLVFQGWLEKVQASRTAAPLPKEDDAATVPVNEVPMATDLRRPGWAPLTISSVTFGLAHLGHGVDPVPLVILGFILGYLYQRTHRILPCVVCHVLFNAFSLLMVWLTVGIG